MIVLNVLYYCKPGKREAFFNAINAEGLAAACRAEEGNICYSYYMAADAPDEMLLLERWKDTEALAEHMQLAHFKRIGELKDEFVIETQISRYEA